MCRSDAACMSLGKRVKLRMEKEAPGAFADAPTGKCSQLPFPHIFFEFNRCPALRSAAVC